MIGIPEAQNMTNNRHSSLQEMIFLHTADLINGDIIKTLDKAITEKHQVMMEVLASFKVIFCTLVPLHYIC